MSNRQNRYAKDDIAARYPGTSRREYNQQRKRYDAKKLSVQDYVDKWGSAPKTDLKRTRGSRNKG